MKITHSHQYVHYARSLTDRRPENASINHFGPFGTDRWAIRIMNDDMVHIAGIVLTGETLEELAVKWLANRNDGKCPECGGDCGYGHSVDIEYPYAYQKCSCEDCECAWEDQYVLCYQRIVESGDVETETETA